MKSAHTEYLRKIVGTASMLSGGAVVAQVVSGGRHPDTPVHRLMRDIVCDARFHTVLANDVHWRNLALWRIGEFIDGLQEESWNDPERLGRLKERFLTEWLTRHIFGMPEDERAEVERRIGRTGDEPDMDRRRRLADGLELYVDEEATGNEDTETDSWWDAPPDFENFRYADDRTEKGDPMGTRNLPKPMQEYFSEIAPAAEDSGEESAKDGNGDVEGNPHEAEARFLESIDPALTALAREIGRSGEGGELENGRFSAAARSDISGIRTGNRLEDTLPAELALLAGAETEDLFIRRFVEQQLQTFSSASRSAEPSESDNGPVYVCIDSSSSMEGRPERMARSIALAIGIIAQSEKRPVCLINYSHGVDYFLLTDYDRQRERLVKFLTFSFGGSNNESRLFEFIFRYLPWHPRFRHVGRRFRGADMLVISDFEWGPLCMPARRALARARSEGMRIYCISVGGIRMWGGGREFLEEAYAVYGYTEEGLTKGSAPAGLRKRKDSRLKAGSRD